MDGRIWFPKKRSPPGEALSFVIPIRAAERNLLSLGGFGSREGGVAADFKLFGEFSEHRFNQRSSRRRRRQKIAPMQFT